MLNSVANCSTTYQISSDAFIGVGLDWNLMKAKPWPASSQRPGQAILRKGSMPAPLI